MAAGEYSIEHIPPLDAAGNVASPIDAATLRLRARQISHFMGRVQLFYKDQLGLRRTDPDPPPNPYNEEQTDERVGRLRESGPVQTSALQYIGAFAVETNGLISGELDAIQGLLVLQKPKKQLCHGTNHTPTEIYEWDTLDSQGEGLGGELLRTAAPFIHPEDEVIADIAAPNTHAMEIYAHYGFERDFAIEPMDHGVFDVQHLRFHVPGATFLERLGAA